MNKIKILDVSLLTQFSLKCLFHFKPNWLNVSVTAIIFCKMNQLDRCLNRLY